MKNTVKTRIASFEAHNQEIRSPPSSPLIVSPASSPGRASSPSVNNNFREHADASNNVAMDRRTSSTTVAKQNRIHRLQRETADSLKLGLRAPQPPDSPGGTTFDQLEQRSSAQYQQRLNGQVGNLQTERSRRRPIQTAHHSESIEIPDFDHPSEEDRSTSGQRKSAARMTKAEKMKKIRDHSKRGTRPNRHSAARSRTNSHRSATHGASLSSPTAVHVANSSDHPTDDEMTQTSVRQIVGNYDESPVTTYNPKDYVDDGVSAGYMWKQDGEEKSEKAEVDRSGVRGGIMMSRSSSTEYETDGDGSLSRLGSTLYGEEVIEDRGSSLRSGLKTTSGEAALLGQYRQKHAADTVKDDDERTFDYADRDDGSQVSLSYEQRRQKEAREREAREAAVAAAKAKMDSSSFVQTGDMERYRRILDTPIVKTAAVVTGAATIGCVVLGPVGLLVGAAAVGIGVGIMQIVSTRRSRLDGSI